MYEAYSPALTDPNHELSKVFLAKLSEQAHLRGLCGSASLQLLFANKRHIAWEDMQPDVFNTFYRFVFFICREPGKRNVQTDTAVAAWRLVLRGRFRLLDRWCDFISRHHRGVITEDTWAQVLDFSRTVLEDLSNYDPSGAWPVLLDDFVAGLRSKRSSCLASPPVEPVMLANGSSALWSASRMVPMSPRSGSKRKPPDVGDVADQLQLLPLLSETPEVDRLILNAKRMRIGAGRSPGGGSAASSPLSSGSRPPPSPQQQGSPCGSPMAMTLGAGGSGVGGGSPGGGASPCAATMFSPPAGFSLGQPAIPPSAAAGSSRLPPLMPGMLHLHQQQQVAHHLQQRQQQAAAQAASALPPPALGATAPHTGRAGTTGGGMPRPGPPPPQAPAGHTLEYEFASRSHSVNALMQATVSEALGLQ